MLPKGAAGWIRDPKSRRWAMLIFVAGTALRLWFVLRYHPPGDHIESDMWLYHLRAKNLIAGQLTAWDTFTPVGYPFVLSLMLRVFDDGPRAMGVLQALMGGVTAALTHRIGVRLSERGVVALLAGLMVAVSPPLVFYSGLLLTETTTAFGIALFCWLMLRAHEGHAWIRPVLAGVVLGAVAVVRPNFLAFYPLLAWLGFRAWRAGDRQALRRTGLVLACTLPLLVTVVARNTGIRGQLTGLASNGGVNFYLNFGDMQGIRYREGGLVHEIAPVPNGLRGRGAVEAKEPFYEQGHFFSLGFQLIRDDPSRLLRATKNLWRGAGLGDMGYWPGFPQHARLLKLYARGFGYLVILPAVLSLLLLLFDRSALPATRRTRALLWSASASSALAMYAFLADPRIRVPFDPLLLLLALDFHAHVISRAARAVYRLRLKPP